MKAIYKITNQINYKIYIGQSINPQERWQAHIKHSNYPIGQAITKYGVENFTFEILEWVHNYNEREMYWINYYQSCGINGYNLNHGGNGQLSISLNEATDIIKLLKTTNYSFIKIAELAQVSTGIVAKINKGVIYPINDYYPIVNTRRENFSESEIRELELEFSQYNNFTMDEISDCLGITRTIAYQVNNGKHHFSSKKLKYPLIEYKNILTVSLVQEIEHQLKNTKDSYSIIAHKFDIDREVVQKINYGQHKYSTYKNTKVRKNNTRMDKDEFLMIEQLLENKSVIEVSMIVKRSETLVRNIKYKRHKFSKD